jgi:hypothetical protein
VRGVCHCRWPPGLEGWEGLYLVGAARGPAGGSDRDSNVENLF